MSFQQEQPRQQIMTRTMERPEQVQMQPVKKGLLRKQIGVPVWAIFLILAILLAGLLNIVITANISANTNRGSITANLSARTTKPTVTSSQVSAQKWRTLQSFTGNGNKKTTIFSVPKYWRIAWSCYGFDDGTGVSGTLVISVYDANGKVSDFQAVYATCRAGAAPTSDATEVYQGGSVYLDVSATGNWGIEVEEVV